MKLSPTDLSLILGYLVFIAVLGFWIKKKATKGLSAYYLAGRNVPWWMLGLKAVWVTHIYWGWFIICFYMAFQAKWIRRSGVMTFAEWNRTRYGDTRDAEKARSYILSFLWVSY